MISNQLWLGDGTVSKSFIDAIAVMVPASLREPWIVEMLNLIADLEEEQRPRAEIAEAFAQEAKEAILSARQ